MAQFQPAFRYVFPNETAEYTDRPSDRGGPTKYGITLATLRAWRKSDKLGPSDVAALTEPEAEQCYEEVFWTPLGLSGLKDQVVATAIFDQAVNRSGAAAVRDAQRAAGLGGRAIDGIMGTGTIGAINQMDARSFLAAFIPCVQNEYINIALADPSQLANLHGWLNRSEKLLTLMI